MALLDRPFAHQANDQDRLVDVYARTVDEIGSLPHDALWPLGDSLMFAMSFHQYLWRRHCSSATHPDHIGTDRSKRQGQD